MRLDVHHLSHRYGGLPVLDDVSLVVDSGEVVAVVGPSGCGKSTLLAVLGGLLQPSAGQVLQVGTPPAGCLNPLTYVFQDFALLPWRSVAGNVELVLLDHGLPRTERRARVDEVLALTGLTAFRTAYPKQLSGGMRQRVGIARALAVRPAVLLMDEPLSALDAQTRMLLLDEFAALFAGMAVTAVYVTHNLAEAVRLAGRIVVLSRRPGRIREIVPVPIPVARRATAGSDLARIEDHLWNLIRDDAAEANRELVDG